MEQDLPADPLLTETAGALADAGALMDGALWLTAAAILGRAPDLPPETLAALSPSRFRS